MTIESIFAAAAQKPTADREAYLNQACGDDAELRRKIDRLLAAHDAASDFLQPQTGNYESRGDTDQAAGTLIDGKYKLLERIGEGGMGSVWMAQQSEPVKRLVAVKLIKAGMDSKAVLARFEAERQALAVMDHPNIAKILDGGLADSRPYFVMELVKGVPITRYCDEHKLTPRQRLELFVPVCQAIPHAHQKGIIHRDIKPSNVMIALYDDKPVPKVIDFGVAKATGQTLTEQTLHTGFGGIVGTPEYMSPEQASLNNLDIDTRSDIYSLGILLYELLAGSPPFKRKQLEQAGLLEILRVIREDEPPKPSTKLSTADALPSLSANRGTEPKKLTGILRNELDWIVMKALEKDRVRRYETANGFAADINRYLAGEPVNAHPPSAAYRLKKTLNKHKGPVIASTAVAVALLVGLVGFAWQAQVAQRERNLAQAERNRAVTAEAETNKRADELKLVSDFQAQMLGQVDPTQAGILLTQDVKAKFESALSKAGVPEEERTKQIEIFATHWQRVNATDAARELIDRTILKPAIAAIDKQFADQPEVDSYLRETLAQRYMDLGMYDAAFPLEQKALESRRRVLGEEHPLTLIAINNMGWLLHEQGKFAEAESHYREALEKRRRVLSVDHPDTLATINNVAEVLKDQGKFNEAEKHYREVLAKQDPHNPNTILLLTNIGGLLKIQGKYAEAEKYHREALNKSRAIHGEDHPNTCHAVFTLGTLLHAQGKLSEAELYLREAVQMNRRFNGAEHPDTLLAIACLGTLLLAQGKEGEAEAFIREANDKGRVVLGDDHPSTLAYINNLGVLVMYQGKASAAESYIREALDKRRWILPKDHPNTLLSINNLGAVLQRQGKLTDAELHFRDVLEIRRRTLGQDHPDTILSIDNLAWLLKEQGNFKLAETHFRESLETGRKVLGDEHSITLSSMNGMGELQIDLGKLDEAEPLLRRVLEIRRRLLGDEHADTLSSITSFGWLRLAQGKYADAVQGLSAHEPAVRKAFRGDNAWRLASFLTNLGKARTGLGEMTTADSRLVEAHAIFAQTRGPSHKDTRDCIQAIVDLYTAWHAAEPGKGYDTRALEWKTKLEVMNK
ncbi:MAG: tetratricopeptide repeat protein [Gemmataceae bacterium]